MKLNDKEYLQSVAIYMIRELKPDVWMSIGERHFPGYTGLSHVATMLSRAGIIKNLSSQWRATPPKGGEVFFKATDKGIAIRDEISAIKYPENHKFYEILKQIEDANDVLSFVLE